MTFEEVRQFMKDNENDEQVQAYIKGLITPDRVQVFLESDEGKRFLQPRLDSYFAKGLDTWKNNNLQKIVDEKISEKYPAETEQEKRIKALEQKLAEEERARKKQETEKKAIRLLTENELPVDFVDFLSADDDVELNGKFETLKATLGAWSGKILEGKFKEAGRIPRKPSGLDDGVKNPWSKEDWNLTEQGKMLKENPELAKYFKENTRR
jgi:uncharacterized protein YdaU (DUF1376 family)